MKSAMRKGAGSRLVSGHPGSVAAPRRVKGRAPCATERDAPRLRPPTECGGPAAAGTMTDALVTGGTGFVGANVVRELLAQRRRVRVLARPRGDRRALAGLDVEIYEGDLLDPASVQRAVKGVDVVFHVAADYRLWAPDSEELHRVNVGGTRAVLEAAGAAGVSRVVYTSTVGALGIPEDGVPGTEATPVSLRDTIGPYKASKFLAEQVALGFAHQGLPVVVVNPSAPVGPWDVKPTPTGRMIVDFLEGRMFATLDTGLNLVHVRDVARGHLLRSEEYTSELQS